MKRKPQEDQPPSRTFLNGNGSKNRRPRSFGPIQNLEEYVPPDWWEKIFNANYLKTDGDVVNDERLTAWEVDRILELLRPEPGDRILDLCCGQGRHVLELARRGYFNTEGLDRSRYLISRARREAKSSGLPVLFREGDARKLPYSQDSFDFALLLGNSFGYFETIEDDLRVLKELYRVLKPAGKLLIDLADGEYLRQNFQPRSWEWIDEKHFVCRERSLSRDGQRLISREVITHVEKGVIADQFYAERLYTPKQLQELLERSGFHNVQFHESLRTSSQRNQDLGMMEKRIIITAQSTKMRTSPKARISKKHKHVAVLLGDPTLNDPLKPNRVFDEDDFYTVHRLKEALESLPGYRFTYLFRHKMLIEDLIHLKGKVDYVLNLCDEGFNNDPRKELHIPALLEMLDIPYTGAGPQCLAYCYDKSLVRGVAIEMQIPVPRAVFIKPTDNTYQIPLNYPVIVKPNFGDSSFGITKNCVVHEPQELLSVIGELRQKFGYEKPILVEEFLTGKDLTVGIIGNPPSFYQVLPIAEEDYSLLPPDLPPICGYEAKWLPDSPYAHLRSIPAELPEELERAIIEWCLKLFERLECRDYARFDLRLDAQGVPRLLEVNPNPGWCWDGHLAKMCAFIGWDYPAMLLAILRASEQRLGIEDAHQGVLIPENLLNQERGALLSAGAHP
jgi:D-alanine-D-alanine ligase